MTTALKEGDRGVISHFPRFGEARPGLPELNGREGTITSVVGEVASGVTAIFFMPDKVDDLQGLFAPSEGLAITLEELEPITTAVEA